MAKKSPKNKETIKESVKNTAKEAVQEKKTAPANTFPFGKMNYMIMIAGLVLIAAGFFIMSLETAEQGFGFLGMTLGPIILFAGFLVEFGAVLYKPKS